MILIVYTTLYRDGGRQLRQAARTLARTWRRQGRAVRCEAIESKRDFVQAVQCCEAIDALHIVDAVILACTHYAALQHDIAARLPHAHVVDPALHVVASLALTPGQGQLRAYSTGPVAQCNRVAPRLISTPPRFVPCPFAAQRPPA
ncbi:MAG: hypothetical protein ACPGUV_04275 [Polyangiales bacterium]